MWVTIENPCSTFAVLGVINNNRVNIFVFSEYCSWIKFFVDYFIQTINQRFKPQNHSSRCFTIRKPVCRRALSIPTFFAPNFLEKQRKWKLWQKLELDNDFCNLHIMNEETCLNGLCKPAFSPGMAFAQSRSWNVSWLLSTSLMFKMLRFFS